MYRFCVVQVSHLDKCPYRNLGVISQHHKFFYTAKSKRALLVGMSFVTGRKMEEISRNLITYQSKFLFFPDTGPMTRYFLSCHFQSQILFDRNFKFHLLPRSQSGCTDSVFVTSCLINLLP